MASDLPNLRMFVVQSAYDMYTVGRLLGAERQNAVQEGEDSTDENVADQIGQLVNGYHGFLEASLYAALLSAMTPTQRDRMVLFTVSQH